MRVITGSKKGRKLDTMKGLNVRPTTDKVKESIFSALQFDIDGCNFLDLFAGSGQMGIEALSRGASRATFVDASRDSINIIKRNLAATDFVNCSAVFKSDSILFLKKNSLKFDIAFLDPPYNMGLLQKALPLLTGAVSKSGFIVCESSFDDILPDAVDDFSISKKYVYGKIVVTIYKRADVI